LKEAAKWWTTGSAFKVNFLAAWKGSVITSFHRHSGYSVLSKKRQGWSSYALFQGLIIRGSTVASRNKERILFS
jgi:hypothetical protein